LTPLSVESSDLGFESIILPNLTTLELGGLPEGPRAPTPHEIEKDMSKALVRFVSGRKAAYETQSIPATRLSSHGFTENLNHDNVAFTTFGKLYSNLTCRSRIQTLTIRVRLHWNEDCKEWLKENVEKTDLKGLQVYYD